MCCSLADASEEDYIYLMSLQPNVFEDFDYPRCVWGIDHNDSGVEEPAYWCFDLQSKDLQTAVDLQVFKGTVLDPMYREDAEQYKSRFPDMMKHAFFKGECGQPETFFDFQATTECKKLLDPYHSRSAMCLPQTIMCFFARKLWETPGDFLHHVDE